MPMFNLSNARKIGTLASAAAKQAGRTRTGNALLSGIRATASHFGRVLHQLWLEVTGFVFLCLAVFGASAIVHEYVKYHAGQTSSSHVWIAIGFTLMFGWFAVSSFWRVWRKS
ncbi:MAG: hypothetical protein WB421_04295 [Terriglobales bacterium]